MALTADPTQQALNGDLSVLDNTVATDISPYYDSIWFPSTAQQGVYLAFAKGLGETDPVVTRKKTKNETCVKEGKKLAYPQAMVILSFSLFFYNYTAADRTSGLDSSTKIVQDDVRAIMDAVIFRVIVSGSTQFETPLRVLTAGGGIAESSPVQLGLAQPQATIAIPPEHAILVGRKGEGEQFYCEFEFARSLTRTLTGDTGVMIILWVVRRVGVGKQQ